MFFYIAPHPPHLYPGVNETRSVSFSHIFFFFFEKTFIKIQKKTQSSHPFFAFSVNVKDFVKNLMFNHKIETPPTVASLSGRASKNLTFFGRASGRASGSHWVWRRSPRRPPADYKPVFSSTFDALPHQTGHRDPFSRCVCVCTRGILILSVFILGTFFVDPYTYAISSLNA